MSVSTAESYCPLCGDQLKDLGGEVVIEFPKTKGYAAAWKIAFVSRLFFGIALLAAIVCVIVNIATFKIAPIRWSIVASLGSFYGWYLLSKCILKKGNATKILFKQLVTISILIICIDATLTDFSGWSLCYGVPILAFSVGVSVAVIAFSRLLHYREHLHYSLLSALFGSLQLPLLFLCDVKWLIIVSGTVNVGILIALWVFAQKSVQGEIVKRLHF